jgi:predicted deacylase
MDSRDVLQQFVFDSARAGPCFLVLGAVHGNGTTGTKALQQIAEQLHKEPSPLECGRLIAVPTANPRACDRGQKYAETLNRRREHHTDRKSQEEKAAHELLSLIDQCDILLDVHSCHPLDKPFVFVDHDKPSNRALAAATGLEYACTGWNEMYQRMGKLTPGPTDYAESRGKTAAVLECGWADSAEAVAATRQCIQKCLQQMGMIDRSSGRPSRPYLKSIRFDHVVVKDRDGSLARPWKHLDRVRKGEVIARYDDGAKVTADRDGYILFPAPAARSRDEWFYLGRDDRS